MPTEVGMPRACGGRGGARRAFALLAVLVVAMMAAMIVVSLMFRLNAEENAHAASASGERSRAVAMSGIAQAMQIVRDNAHAHEIWRDNPDSFRDQLVVDDGVDRWYFTLYAPPAEEGGEIRYGLTDEASRLNLRRGTAESIAELPDVSLVVAERIKALVGGAPGGAAEAADDEADEVETPDVDPAVEVEAEEDLGIFEELDALFEAGAAADEAEADGGAEAAAFGVSGGEAGAGGDPDFAGMVTLDHLLAVEGVSVGLLYGHPEEAGAGDEAARSISAVDLPLGNAARLRGRSLRDLATLISREPNVDLRGRPRVNINDAEASLSDLEFSEEMLAAIEAHREGGEPLTNLLHLLTEPPPTDDADDEESDEEGDDEDAEDEEAEQTGSQTSSSSSSSGGVSAFAIDVTLDDVRELLDRCTITDEAILRGRVNVNTAPAEVLAALPVLDETLAEAIIAARGGLEEEQRESIVWLFENEVLDLHQFVDVSPYLTTRSYQFHVQVLAYAVPSRRYRVMEAVIDIAEEKPHVVFLRDLTRLGPPLPIEDNGVSSSQTFARMRP